MTHKRKSLNAAAWFYSQPGFHSHPHAPTTQETLYRAAQAKDAAFHAECVRQFGAARAGDMRYHNSAHDLRTTQARIEYQQAAEKLSQSHRKD